MKIFACFPEEGKASAENKNDDLMHCERRGRERGRDTGRSQRGKRWRGMRRLRADNVKAAAIKLCWHATVKGSLPWTGSGKSGRGGEAAGRGGRGAPFSRHSTTINVKFKNTLF